MELQKAKSALKKYFGYDSFRPLQAEIIQTVYDKKDTLVLMPTGGGKSICYQIPAITTEGTCLVVSPLISLMKDQVEGLKANGVSAAFLNSSLTLAEQRQVEDDLYYGKLDLVYVSPEKLLSTGFLPLLKKANINLFAIDEAHCISSWGHDFRPEYTRLKFLKQSFSEIPIIALTATADKVTRRDIAEQLNLNEPEIFVASFDRPNLSLAVKPGQKRFQQMLDFIKERPRQSGIVYCLSRKNTETIARKLKEAGMNANFYHAGMNSMDRSRVQEEFVKDNITIICATIAFGMGIDKSNIRWVIHYNLPKNIEGYYQEIGRAGRDGARADTLLFYSYRDVMVMRDIISEQNSGLKEIQLQKLERIQQYSESLICRRKMLLNYFGESYSKDCGNCDICKDPPQYIDGTVLAQKALSAVFRLKQKVGINILVDVLRGSGRKEILSRGYHRIKTYGAGRDISTSAWKFYIMQMINSGLIEIAYDQKNVLKLTSASENILFNGDKVKLVTFQTQRAKQEARKAAAKPKTKTQRVRDELFEKLRALRRELAQQRGIPPYQIFHDSTLEEMAAMRPMTDGDMKDISGVGERKFQQYGDVFLEAVKEYVLSKSEEGVKIRGTSHWVTWELYQKGGTVESIAEKRGYSPVTIVSHLAKVYESGEDLPIHDFVSPEEIERVFQSLEERKMPEQLKPLFEKMNEEISYGKIKLALAKLKKDGEIE